MSIGFLLVFTAYFTCQNFASKLLEEDGYDHIGYYSVGIVYLTFAFSSLLSKAIMKKLRKVSIAMSIGALCHTFWIISFILASFNFEKDDKQQLPFILNRDFIKFIIILSSIVTGVGSGLLWVS